MVHDDEHEKAHHEGMAHDQEATAENKVVVETPDFSSVPAPFKRNVSQLLDQYLKLKDALVSSDANAAKKAAADLNTSAKALPLATLQAPDQKDFAEEQTEKVRKAASAIETSTNINAQREQLESLSEGVFALTKAFGATDKKLYYQHCPMALNDKGGYWLSTNKEIRNPYFGAKMMTCGSNVEELN